MELDLTLFEKNISNMNLFELADWLDACRNQVKRENFDTDSEYYEKLQIFCDAWEKHYNKYEAFYSNKSGKSACNVVFYQALFYTTVKDNAVLVTKLDAGEHICPIATCKDLENITIHKDATLGEIDSLIGNVFDEIVKIFEGEKYKDALKKYLVNWRFSEIRIIRYVRFRDKGVNKVLASSYNELETLAQQPKSYVHMELKKKRTNYTNGLKQYDITKSVYSYFCSNDKCEKDFTKKMFVNLGFLLGLSLEHLEELLEYNGYSISENSHRKFDQIIRRAFKCGFSREMTIGLLDIEKKKGYNVPNLTTNSKQK